MHPNSPYNGNSTAEEVTSSLTLSGKTALITGVTSGIGLETMRVLASRGARVIGTGRNLSDVRRVCKAVGGDTAPVRLELSDYEDIGRAAQEVRSLADTIDMLICNAGVMGIRRQEFVQGLERHFAVNHLGHFILVNHLRSLVENAPQGRFVIVASNAYEWAPPEGICFDRLSTTDPDYSWQVAYGQSKLANGLFARELARRLAGSRATAASLHPGRVDTRLWRHEPWRVRLRSRLFGASNMKTVDRGAATTCYVATDSSLSRVSGRYFENCHAATPSGRMEDDDLARSLWEYSEHATRQHLPSLALTTGHEPARFASSPHDPAGLRNELAK